MRRASLPALLAGLILLTAQPAAAITFGTRTGPDEQRNVGAMIGVIDGDRYQLCTGTLIDRGAFLTAAHCIAAFPVYDLEVPGDVFVNFRHDLAAAGDIPVTAAHAHPRFGHDQGDRYDVGVLEFLAGSTPAGLAAAVVAAPGYLSTLGRALRRDRFTAVGYGQVRDAKERGPHALADASERRLVEQGALSLRRAWVTFSENPATGNGGSCYGDSGGPHFHRGLIVSITVTGDRFCRAIDTTYRMDTRAVREFLAPFLP